jgi:hypothetical protein
MDPRGGGEGWGWRGGSTLHMYTQQHHKPLNAV